MKTLIASILLIASSIFPADNNQPDRIVIDGHVTFEEVFESNDDQNELMLKAKTWVAKKYSVLKNSVQIEDNENGLLVVNGVDVYLYDLVLNEGSKRKDKKTQNTSGTIHFQLTIVAKDNKVKMVMDQIEYGALVTLPYLDETTRTGKDNEAERIEAKIHELFAEFSAALNRRSIQDF